MQKDYFANQIVEMHCVRHFIMLMIRKKIDVISPQVMCYIFCHYSPILNLNSKTRARRKVIIYNTTNGITQC